MMLISQLQLCKLSHVMKTAEKGRSGILLEHLTELHLPAPNHLPTRECSVTEIPWAIFFLGESHRKWTILKCIIQWLFVYSHYLYLVIKHFYHPNKWPLQVSPNKQPFPISTSHHFLATTSLLSGYLTILHFSYKWNHTLYYLLCLTSFTKHYILRFVHILVCMISFWSSICMCIGVGVHMYYFLFTHSCVAEHFSWFQLLAINNAAMNIPLQLSFNVFSKYVFLKYFWYMPSCGVAELYDNSVLNFWRTVNCFPQCWVLFLGFQLNLYPDH